MPFEYNHRDGFTIQDGGLSAPVDTAGRLQQPALSSRSFFPLKARKNQVTAKEEEERGRRGGIPSGGTAVVVVIDRPWSSPHPGTRYDGEGRGPGGKNRRRELRWPLMGTIDDIVTVSPRPRCLREEGGRENLEEILSQHKCKRSPRRRRTPWRSAWRHGRVLLSCQ
jgi:hypothetical protein